MKNQIKKWHNFFLQKRINLYEYNIDNNYYKIIIIIIKIKIIMVFILRDHLIIKFKYQYQLL